MILPSGPENISLRRFPVVSMAIMGCSFLFYLIYLFWPLPNLGPIDTAMTYRANRSYLVGDPRLDDLIRANRTRIRYSPVEKPEDADELRVEQQELEELTRRGLASVDRLPHNLMGFRPNSGNLFGLLFHFLFHDSAFFFLLIFAFFYLTAPYVEDIWGRVFFPIFYVISGVVSALGLMVIYPNSGVPLYGGAAPVAAVMGAYMVCYYRTRFRFVYVIPLVKEQTFASPLVFFPLWFGAQLIIKMSWSKAMGYTYMAFWAQIVGFMFGIAVALVIKKGKLEKKLYQSDFDRLPPHEQYRIRLEKAFHNGQGERAFEILGQAFRDYPDDFDFMAQYWNQAVRLKREGECLAAGRKLVAVLSDQGDYDQAFFHWRELADADPANPLPVEVILKLVHGLLSIPHKIDAEEVVAHVFDNLGPDMNLSAYLSLVELAVFTSPEVAVMAMETVLAMDVLPEEDQDQLGRELADMRQLYPNLGKNEEVLEIAISAEAGVHLEMLEDPFVPTHIKQLVCYRASPETTTDTGIEVLLAHNRQHRFLRFDQVRGLAAAAIRPIGDKPYLVLDIMADNPFEDKNQHAMMRFDSRYISLKHMTSQTDPTPVTAFRSLIQTILTKSDAAPLPDEVALTGPRFLTFNDIDQYENEVFGLNADQHF